MTGGRGGGAYQGILCLSGYVMLIRGHLVMTSQGLKTEAQADNRPGIPHVLYMDTSDETTNLNILVSLQLTNRFSLGVSSDLNLLMCH